jgi:hypothetical protein
MEKEIILRGVANGFEVPAIHGMRDMIKFCGKNVKLNNGKPVDILLKITTLPAGQKERRIAYIHKVIIEKFKSAFWESGERKTNDQVKEFIESISTVTKNKKCDIESLDVDELGDLIDEMKEFGAVNLGVFIDDKENI